MNKQSDKDRISTKIEPFHAYVVIYEIAVLQMSGFAIRAHGFSENHISVFLSPKMQKNAQLLELPGFTSL